MRLVAENIGKRFGSHWLFRNLNFQAESGMPVVIKGPNGSGKSTLLQILSGFMLPNEGKTEFFTAEGKVYPQENLAFNLTFTAPYTELIEEFTPLELLKFHKNYRNLTLPDELLLAKVSLLEAKNKPIAKFSTGMKQRMKLALAFHTEADILFLDEPTTNLDSAGKLIYSNLIKEAFQQKLVIIGSNVEDEYNFLPFQTVDISASLA